MGIEYLVKIEREHLPGLDAFLRAYTGFTEYDEGFKLYNFRFERLQTAQTMPDAHAAIRDNGLYLCVNIQTTASNCLLAAVIKKALSYTDTITISEL